MPPLLQLQALLPLATSPTLPALQLAKAPLFSSPRQVPSLRLSALHFSSPRRPRCSLLSVPTEVSPKAGDSPRAKPTPAEASRTLLELSSTATLTALSHDGWPLAIGARFVVDGQGAPAVCLNQPERLFAADGRSSFHVQFEQTGLRTPQCTLLGSLGRPDDALLLKRLHAKWEKKYGELLQEDLVYLFSVKKVLQIEDLKEDGIWVASSEYSNAEPDPLRNFVENIVDEMNSKHAEDVQRLCSVYVESEFQAASTKIIWIDRLGFDLFIYSESGVFATRIPFPREVTDEKGVKSSFNSMSHLAWEIEKGYATPDFEKVTCLKRIR